MAIRRCGGSRDPECCSPNGVSARRRRCSRDQSGPRNQEAAQQRAGRSERRTVRKQRDADRNGQPGRIRVADRSCRRRSAVAGGHHSRRPGRRRHRRRKRAICAQVRQGGQGRRGTDDRHREVIPVKNIRRVGYRTGSHHVPAAQRSHNPHGCNGDGKCCDGAQFGPGRTGHRASGGTRLSGRRCCTLLGADRPDASGPVGPDGRRECSGPRRRAHCRQLGRPSSRSAQPTDLDPRNRFAHHGFRLRGPAHPIDCARRRVVGSACSPRGRRRRADRHTGGEGGRLRPDRFGAGGSPDRHGDMRCRADHLGDDRGQYRAGDPAPQCRDQAERKGTLEASHRGRSHRGHYGCADRAAVAGPRARCAVCRVDVVHPQFAVERPVAFTCRRRPRRHRAGGKTEALRNSESGDR